MKTLSLNNAFSSSASSRKEIASCAVSFQRFNWLSIISISLDRADAITRISALISFLPEKTQHFNKTKEPSLSTFNLNMSKEFQIISLPESWIASSILISRSFLSMIHFWSCSFSSSILESALSIVFLAASADSVFIFNSFSLRATRNLSVWNYTFKTVHKVLNPEHVKSKSSSLTCKASVSALYCSISAFQCWSWSFNKVYSRDDCMNLSSFSSF